MSETEIIFSVQKSPEGGYEARAVGHSIFAQGVRCHLGDGKPLPEIHFETMANARVLGSAKGEFTVPDDFNDPLPKEIEDLFW